MNHILALDPASACGWAHTNGNGGTWQIGTGEARLATMYTRLSTLCKECPVKLIAVENAGFGSPNPNVQAMHNELLGVIKLFAFHHKAEIKTFRPIQIKMFATARGHATKEQMIRAYMKRFGVNPVDDNHADALWILELAKRPDCWNVTKTQARKRFAK